MHNDEALFWFQVRWSYGTFYSLYFECKIVTTHNKYIGITIQAAMIADYVTIREQKFNPTQILLLCYVILGCIDLDYEVGSQMICFEC